VKRRRLIPEVIQTSSMDCGPACLAALLAGHGVRASYERLRDACQTTVDGTSIDTIEEAAAELGLDVAQEIVPVDHVLRGDARVLPALAVTSRRDGSRHFVILWSQLAGRVQVMDPSVGRRWLARNRVCDDLYVHEVDVPAAQWREAAGSDELRATLRARLDELGVADAGAMIDRALADPGWHAIATLDAAARMVHGLVEARAVRPGTATGALLASLVQDHGAIAADSWFARATDDAETVRVRGAVVVRVLGRRPAQPASRDLEAALVEPPARPWQHLAHAIASGGRTAPAAVVASVALTAVLTVVQAVLWRVLFDASELTTLQLAGAIATLVAFLVLQLAIEAAQVGAIFRLGRRVELVIRTQFLAAIGRLGLRYLRSRPIADMLGRSHVLHQLRELPSVGARILGISLTTVVTGAAIVWLAPESAWLVIGLALAVTVPPIVAHPALAERELRMRTHHGALTRFYLDSLLGIVPARAHGIESAMRREHEGQLVEWVRAARREHALAVAIGAVQGALVCGFAIALVATRVASTDRPAGVLLAVYWVIVMAANAAALTVLVRQLPIYRNLTARQLEPLALRGAGERHDREVELAPGAAAITFADVSVLAGGHVVLAGVTLSIEPGEHVALVGASGAGKSTLLGLLLGWHAPSNGEITVNGRVLDAPTLAALRRRTAWVDPAVQLWNDSLANNLTYGTDGTTDLGAAVVLAQLEDVLGRLPEGMQTSLGEAGGLVSGGEGQRVRLGRGLARRDPALVVLDEPFRGIDRVRRRELLDSARSYWRGSTLICATHDLAETRDFDRVIVVDSGCIVEDGTPAELAARAGSRYARLLADEQIVHELWRRWRHVRIEDGRAVELRS
jgi:ATP-binding cassette subfamily B protein